MPSLYEGLPIVGVEAQCEGLDCYFSDQIDKQIMITNKARMISFSRPKSEWSSIIVSTPKTDRCLTSSEMRRKGYSIQDTVDLLENIYMI